MSSLDLIESYVSDEEEEEETTNVSSIDIIDLFIGDEKKFNKLEEEIKKLRKENKLLNDKLEKIKNIIN